MDFPAEGWTVLKVLKNIFSKYKAILAGGTALALHMGHRTSYDLDFFTHENFRIESIISDIRKKKLPFSVISEGEGYLIVEVVGIKCSLYK